MSEEKTAVNIEHLSKKGKKETYELKDENGKAVQKYLFQFPGILKTQELIDGSTNGVGVTITKDYNESLMKHVIVDPKTDWNYWDNHAGYRRVMEAADRFLGKMLH